jgi:hypothetical protein
MGVVGIGRIEEEESSGGDGRATVPTALFTS